VAGSLVGCTRKGRLKTVIIFIIFTMLSALCRFVDFVRAVRDSRAFVGAMSGLVRNNGSDSLMFSSAADGRICAYNLDNLKLVRSCCFSHSVSVKQAS